MIIIGFFGHPKSVERVCGHYKDDFETKQYVTYTLSGDLAEVISLKPFYATVVNLPLPFYIPVNDLGSGLLQRIDINCDTLTALESICPSSSWANSPLRQLAPPANEMPDYSSLLRNYSGLL